MQRYHVLIKRPMHVTQPYTNDRAEHVHTTNTLGCLPCVLALAHKDSSRNLGQPLLLCHHSDGRGKVGPQACLCALQDLGLQLL